MIELPRGANLEITEWIDDDEFIGKITNRFGVFAAYGWSKGAGFYVYYIDSGHIEKAGTVKRELILNAVEVEVR